ncbi:MFS transporter, partial [Vibrio sp. Vb2736]|nr:MFS transporter [Vibrio sp. Vb2736]
PIGWLMISEIFPLKLRGRGISLAVLVNFGANALVTFAFSPLKVKKLLLFKYIPYIQLNYNFERTMFNERLPT